MFIDDIQEGILSNIRANLFGSLITMTMLVVILLFILWYLRKNHEKESVGEEMESLVKQWEVKIIDNEINKEIK